MLGGNKPAAAAPQAAVMPRQQQQQTVPAESVFEAPGRRYRPEKICVILRGLPGSGKSHVARLLRDLENVRHSGGVAVGWFVLVDCWCWRRQAGGGAGVWTTPVSAGGGRPFGGPRGVCLEHPPPSIV